MKDYSRVLMEAVVVGVLLVLVFNIVKYVLTKQSLTVQIFISGALFHILCEITGINIWYVKDYNKILQS